MRSFYCFIVFKELRGKMQTHNTNERLGDNFILQLPIYFNILRTYTLKRNYIRCSLFMSLYLSHSLSLPPLSLSLCLKLITYKDKVPREIFVQCVWNLMAHGDAREGKWRGNWRMEWVASTLHTTSERGVSSVTTAKGKWRENWRMEWVASTLHTSSERGVSRIINLLGPEFYI